MFFVLKSKQPAIIPPQMKHAEIQYHQPRKLRRIDPSSFLFSKSIGNSSICATHQLQQNIY
jgi:hypothetical protein